MRVRRRKEEGRGNMQYVGGKDRRKKEKDWVICREERWQRKRRRR